MTEAIRIRRSSEYEDMALNYQSMEVARLNEVLKAQGIEDKDQRRKICETYFFGQGVFLDAGWLRSVSRRVSPELLFAQRSAAPEGGPGPIQTIYLPGTSFTFGEAAAGNIDYYFEDQGEDSRQLEVGLL